jgi:hypothetical protein
MSLSLSRGLGRTNGQLIADVDDTARVPGVIASGALDE